MAKRDLRPPARPVPPRSPFQRFLEDERRQNPADSSNTPLMQVMQQAGARFQSLDPETRARYQQAHEVQAEAFAMQLRVYESEVEAYRSAAMDISRRARQRSLDTDMTNIRQRICDMVDELRNTRYVQVDNFTIAPGLSASQLERAAEEAGGPLPRGMADFYRRCGGLSLQWRLTEEGEQVLDAEGFAGAIEIMPLVHLQNGNGRGNTVLQDWKGSIWFDFEGGERFKRVLPVDFFVAEACAALYPANPIDADGVVPSVHFHYCGQGLSPLGVSFNEYVALALRARGGWYWLQLLCFTSRDENCAFLKVAPKLFPDLDLDLFLPSHPAGEVKP